ncbi:MAG: hypothetical protein P4L84_03440 [Isosphaeraceae bacterium]|nr:hypothetical protein [Isosphaeraceae bacterium]
MLRHRRLVRGIGIGLVAGFVWGVISPRAEAGKWFQRRDRTVVAAPAAVPTAMVQPRPEPPPLGSFYATPYITVRGNYPAGGGYSPIGLYGDTTLALYGPLSALRATTAPVATYARGYDGRTVLVEGTATSYPNLPELSPVIYPTRATNVFGFRETTTPPWWNSGTNWIDQN